MSGYQEIYCFECNEQLGWATDCGPGPMYFCNSCRRREEEEEDAEEID